MNRALQVRWRRIIIWLSIFAVVAFGLWILDVACLQKNPIIWIDNYSDVVLSIWEIQTTIASLTLASAAFILAKIDNSYYGISVKNLLHLSRHFPKLELSFWEEIICSIVLPIVTWFFVVLDNITAASFLLLFTVFLATSILVECINVITKADIYSDWAKQIVDELVDSICAPVKECKKSQMEAAKQQLRLVLDGIEAEVSAEIRRGMDLYDSATYWYLVRLMDRHPCEEMVQLNEQMHDTLIEWLRLAINTKSEHNIHTLLRTSYSGSLESRWSATGIDIFMYSYYHGDISASCFQQEIDRIAKDILQAHDDYSAKALFVLRNAIYHADSYTFAQIIKEVWRSRPYSNPQIKSNVLITAMAYLYYMAFKEQYMPIEKGTHFLEKLRAFSDATILESYGSSAPKTIKDILSDTELVFDGANFLLNFFNDRAFSWEYISLGEAKSVHLGNDTIEFLTFYCYLFFKHIRLVDLAVLPLDVLLKMKGHIDAEGTINETSSTKYAVFCKWLGKEDETLEKNEWFYISLIAAIKEKMIAEAQAIREKRDVWTSKIGEMKKNVIDHISKSEFCINGIPAKESCVNLRFCDFHLLKDFSEHYGVCGNKQVVLFNLESRLFHQLLYHHMLNRCGVNKTFDNFEKSIIAFEKMVGQMAQTGVRVDQSYNFAFFNRFSHRRFSPHLYQKIQELNSKIRNAGQWDTGYSDVAIYVDSTLPKPGFCSPSEDFITVTERLTDAELKYLCQKYKTPEGFLFKEASNSIGIPFTEEELTEFLRIAAVKIRYSFPAVLPRKKIGFITYYTE